MSLCLAGHYDGLGHAAEPLALEENLWVAIASQDLLAGSHSTRAHVFF